MTAEHVDALLADAQEHLDAAATATDIAARSVRLSAALTSATIAASMTLREISASLMLMRDSLDELAGIHRRDPWPDLPDSAGLGDAIDRARDTAEEQNALADDEADR